MNNTTLIKLRYIALLAICLFISSTSYAGKRETKNVNVGDEFTVFSTYTFKVKKASPTSGVVIHATDNSTVSLNATNFPDDNFRNYLLAQSYGADGILTQTEISNTTSMNVSYKSISSLKGIEYFTALTWLYCDNNQLTSLDVSKNTALTWLYCYSNQLTSLDVSKNTALTWLECYSNQLTSLDVSKNTALTSLYCYSNQLTSLDVSKNTALTSLSCYRNQIKGISMDALISSLPQNTTDEEHKLRIYDSTSSTEGNICTKTQVAAIKAKGWTPYYTVTGYSFEEYEGSDEGSGIESVTAAKQGKTAIYTLDGKRLQTTNAADLPKGIYIINGKKVTVK